MRTHPARRRSLHSPRSQRGAVLYVVLIMLVLMALLGIAGMQVTSMQERMAANYLRSIEFPGIDLLYFRNPIHLAEQFHHPVSYTCYHRSQKKHSTFSCWK